LFGDGFAVWYTKERLIQGPVYGSKCYFSGLAVILDTYSNHNGPHNVSLKKRIEYCQKLIMKLIAAPASLLERNG
jgi:hypothetical protein